MSASLYVTVYAHTPITVWTDPLLFIYMFFISAVSINDAVFVNLSRNLVCALSRCHCYLLQFESFFRGVNCSVFYARASPKTWGAKPMVSSESEDRSVQKRESIPYGC